MLHGKGTEMAACAAPQRPETRVKDWLFCRGGGWTGHGGQGFLALVCSGGSAIHDPFLKE